VCRRAYFGGKETIPWCANSALAKPAAALQRGINIGSRPENPQQEEPHAIIEIDIGEHCKPTIP
jgi:hypothetical protein